MKGRLTEALDFEKQGVQAAADAGDSLRLAISQQALAQTLLELGQVAESIKHSREAIKNFRSCMDGAAHVGQSRSSSGQNSELRPTVKRFLSEALLTLSEAELKLGQIADASRDCKESSELTQGSVSLDQQIARFRRGLAERAGVSGESGCGYDTVGGAPEHDPNEVKWRRLLQKASVAPTDDQSKILLESAVECCSVLPGMEGGTNKALWDWDQRGSYICRDRLGAFYERQGDWKRAYDLRSQALKCRETLLWNEHYDLLTNRLDVADLALKAGYPDVARSELNKLLATVDIMHAAHNTTDVSMLLERCGLLYSLLGQQKDVQRSLYLLHTYQLSKNSRIAAAQTLLDCARISLMLGDSADAMRWDTEAWTLLQQKRSSPEALRDTEHELALLRAKAIVGSASVLSNHLAQAQELKQQIISAVEQRKLPLTGKLLDSVMMFAIISDQRLQLPLAIELTNFINRSAHFDIEADRRKVEIALAGPLAASLVKVKDFDGAIEEHKKLARDFKDLGRDQEAAHEFMCLGSLYREQSKYSLSAGYFDKSLAIRRNLHDQSEETADTGQQYAEILLYFLKKPREAFRQLQDSFRITQLHSAENVCSIPRLTRLYLLALSCSELKDGKGAKAYCSAAMLESAKPLANTSDSMERTRITSLTRDLIDRTNRTLYSQGRVK